MVRMRRMAEGTRRRRSTSTTDEPVPSRVTIGYVLRTLVWPRRRLVSLGLLLIVTNRGAGLVLPASSKVLIDDVLDAGDHALLHRLLAVVAIAVTIQAVTSFLLTRLLSVEAQRMIRDLRLRIMRHVITLPTSYFDRAKSGALVSRVMEDVTGVRNLVGTGLVQLLGGVVTACVALVLLVRISPLLTAVVLGPMLVLGLISQKAFGFIRPIFRERSELRAEVTGRLTESLGGIRVVKGFDAEAREVAAFSDGVHRIYRNIHKTLTASSLVTSSGTFLLGMVTALILWIGGDLVMSGELTTGEFISFTLFLGFLVMPIVQMTSVGTQLTEAFAGLDRVEALLDETAEGIEPERTVTLEAISGDLEFVDVSFAYGEHDVVTGASFRAPSGSVTALVGSSGSGKSTIAGLAATYLKPRAGRVTIDGIDLARVRLGSYRSRLGVVLQDDFLFEGTIRENLLYVRPEASEPELHAAVTAAHVDEFTDRLDDGLDTVIGERGVKLSGGQRQRVSIARAVLADPRVLILDEATSNLDTESERLIQESLETLMRGRTTLVIAHRLSTIRKADQILVMEGGEVVERGTHDELIAREGRYHRLYTYQARI